MKKSGFILLIILVVFSLMLTACDFPPQRAGSTPPPDVADKGADTDGGISGPASTLDVVLAQTQSAAQGGENTDDTSGEGTGGGASAALDEQYLTAEAAVTQTAQAIAAGPVVTATPTTAPTAAPLPEPEVPSSYTLHKGEYPYCIARRFDVNVQDLIRVNGLVSGQVYTEGFKLTIPTDAGPFASARALVTHPASYVTQAGDNFYIIACKFGDISPEVIASANGMDLNQKITSGQTLQIP